MDEVNVAVIAPVLGRDLSFVSDVDPRVRVFDANFAAPGHRTGPDGAAAPGSDLADILAEAEVLAADSDFLVVCSQLTAETRGTRRAAPDPADTAHLGQR